MKKEIKTILNKLNTLSVKEKENYIEQLRKAVDDLDLKLVKLLTDRTSLTLLLGKIKTTIAKEIYAPTREREILSNIQNAAKEPLSKESAIRIFERILDESRAALRNEAIKNNFKK